LGRVCWATSSSNCRLQLSRPMTPRPQAWKRSSNTRRAWLKERALMPPSNRCPAPETVSCSLPYPARRASGIGNWDQPRHTTCRGRPIWPYPTYSAFWSVFGVTCLRLQWLASHLGGFREDGAIGTQEEPAGFRRKLRAWRVLRYSGPVDRGDRREDILLIGTAPRLHQGSPQVTPKPGDLGMTGFAGMGISVASPKSLPSRTGTPRWCRR
jgi:hypothetical protein